MIMDIFAEDGPEYKGNINFGAKEFSEDQNKMKSMYMKHFMLDFMESSMRKVIHDNAMSCAKKVGYFSNLDKDLSNLKQR